MRTRIVLALAASALLLSLGAPAVNAAASATTHHAPAIKAGSTCNILENTCTLRDQTPLYAYGTDLNEGLITHSTGDGYSWVSVGDDPWGLLENTSGECWDWSPTIDQIVTARCIASDHEELWWFDPHAGHFAVKNYAEGTGPNLYGQGSGVFLEFVNANNGGTAWDELGG